MTRNNLFLLLACATAVMIMSTGPRPPARPVTIVSITDLPPASPEGLRPADIAMLQPSFGHP